MTPPEGQGADEAIEALALFVQHAKPVPLTDQVRFDRREFERLLDDLRKALADERSD
ncbi:MAG TPA: hypothetical protein VF255_04450 [Solirubrobacterales bacterium]